jgi:hypothetical protein
MKILAGMMAHAIMRIGMTVLSAPAPCWVASILCRSHGKSYG